MITAEQARALGNHNVDCETNRYLNNIYTHIEASAWYEDSVLFLIRHIFEEVDYSIVLSNIAEELESNGFIVEVKYNGPNAKRSDIYISWSKEG